MTMKIHPRRAGHQDLRGLIIGGSVSLPADVLLVRGVDPEPAASCWAMASGCWRPRTCASRWVLMLSGGRAGRSRARTNAVLGRATVQVVAGCAARRARPAAGGSSLSFPNGTTSRERPDPAGVTEEHVPGPETAGFLGSLPHLPRRADGLVGPVPDGRARPGSVPRPGEVGAGQWSMAGRIRTAITSPEPARAACHPSGPERSGGGASALTRRSQRLSTRVRREPSHSPRTAGQRFDAGYSDNGGGTGCAGSRLISAFSSLPGLK